MRILRTCAVSQAGRLEVQIIRSYRKRGQALNNRALRAGGGAAHGLPDKPMTLAPQEPCDEAELLKMAQTILGKRTSKAKTRAARANAKLPRKKLSLESKRSKQKPTKQG